MAITFSLSSRANRDDNMPPEFSEKRLTELHDKNINKTTEEAKTPAQRTTEAHNQNIKFKTKAFNWVLWLVSIYLLVVVGLLVHANFIGGNHLSDNVLIALLTTTTATVVGLPLVVIKGLFAGETKQQQKSPS